MFARVKQPITNGKYSHRGNHGYSPCPRVTLLFCFDVATARNVYVYIIDAKSHFALYNYATKQLTNSSVFFLFVAGLVPKPSHEGQEAKIGFGLAVRRLHGSSVDGCLHRHRGDSTALLALRPWQSSGDRAPHLSELSSHRALQPLSDVLAVAALSATSARCQLPHEPDVALDESPAAAGAAAFVQFRVERQRGLRHAEPDDGGKCRQLQAHHGAGDEPALGDLERL